ncbi:MAG: hypothetical protein P4M11_11115 [Candidatus Pacebacteria bacterium]|nr:hypothetical protein [Candidatus Paceibacterota bacterium]
MKIAQFQDVSQFRSKDATVATLIYNAANTVFKSMFLAVNNFVASISTLYTQQLSETISIVLICIFGALIFVQAPISYMLNSVVISQVDIFLKLPNRVCAKLERAANDFVTRIHVRGSYTHIR